MKSQHVLEKDRTIDSRRPSRAVIVRSLLRFEAASFLAAAAVHGGVVLERYRHAEAAAAETVIGLVLLAGIGLTRAPHPWAVRGVFAAQAFALAGTLIGLIAIALGIGPQTFADVAYHLAILVILATGIAICAHDATTNGTQGWTRR